MDTVTCIVVLGTARSGSSAVAGVLHRLGVRMGDGMTSHALANPTGFYEDKELSELMAQGVGRWWTHWAGLWHHRHNNIEYAMPDDALLKWVARLRYRQQTCPLWGVKDFRLVHFLADFLDIVTLGADVRVIRIDREVDSIAGSIYAYPTYTQLAEGRQAIGTKTEARIIAREMVACVDDALAGYGDTILHMRYEDILARPQEAVDMIAEFVGAVSSEDAVAFIDAGLRRF